MSDSIFRTGPSKKISQFVGSTTVPASSYFTYYDGSVNRRVLFSDLLIALGATGVIEQDGAITGTPTLDIDGDTYLMRNLEDGPGVKASVSPENGITLEHNIDQDTAGVPILKDLTSNQITAVSLVAGSGMSVSADGDHIQIALSATPVTTKTVIVSEEADFPTAIGGVITLLGDTEYLIIADITTANRFVLQSDTVVSGSDGTIISLTYTGTDAMFTTVNNSNKIKDIQVDCPSGDLLDVSCASCTNIFQMLNSRVVSCDTLGTIDGMNTVNFNSMLFEDIITDGFTFLNNNFVINFSDCVVTQNAGTFIELGSATSSAFSVGTCLIVLAGGTTFLSGVVDSGNINAGGLGSVLNTRTLGAGTTLNNITVEDNLWQFALNDTIPDTRVDGLLSMNTNVTATVITVATTPVLVAGTWVVEEESKFVGTTAGRLTYTGPKDFKTPITISVTGAPVTGTNIPITYHLYLNGSPVARALQGNIINSGSPKNTSLIWQLSMTTNDYLEVWVSNDTTTSNVTIFDAIFRVN